jgi:hypothetical protein
VKRQDLSEMLKNYKKLRVWQKVYKLCFEKTPYLSKTDYKSFDNIGFQKQDCHGAIAPRNDRKTALHLYLSLRAKRSNLLFWTVFRKHLNQ